MIYYNQLLSDLDYAVRRGYQIEIERVTGLYIASAFKKGPIRAWTNRNKDLYIALKGLLDSIRKEQATEPGHINYEMESE